MTPVINWTALEAMQGRFIRLEPMHESHIPLLIEAGKDQHIFKYMIYGDLSQPGNMEAWVKRLLVSQQRGTDMPFTVFLNHNDQVAGSTRYLDLRKEHRSLEIGGTWFSPNFQGTVINIESKYLLLKYAFENLGCIRVQFKADLLNERSNLAIAKLGATREGVLRNHHILPDGRIRDSVFYSILDREWQQVKKGLEKKIDSFDTPMTIQ